MMTIGVFHKIYIYLKYLNIYFVYILYKQSNADAISYNKISNHQADRLL